MNIGTSFLNAAKQSPGMRKMARGIVSILYNTQFLLRSGPTLTSDELHISTNIRHDRWYKDFGEIRTYVAKQNHDGLWDLQRVSYYTHNLESWTSKEMVKLGATIENVRALFATQNRFISPSGREIILKNRHDEDSALSKGGRVKTDYVLCHLGNYRDHPAWAQLSSGGNPEKLTP